MKESTAKSVNYMSVVDGGNFPESRLLGYIHACVSNIIGHELLILIEKQKNISPFELENEIEKIADSYIGGILGEKDLLDKKEREVVAERVINALPLNLDRFTDTGKNILKQLSSEMQTTFSTYKEQQVQGLVRQKKRTQDSLANLLKRFNA